MPQNYRHKITIKTHKFYVNNISTITTGGKNRREEINESEKRKKQQADTGRGN
jgi:hypothetical protein